MIDFFKDKIKNIEPLRLQGASTVFFSKFYHGEERESQKILFLVTDGSTPLAVLKIVRTHAFSESLKKESLSQRRYVPDFFVESAPVLYEGEYNGIYFYIEKYIQGTFFDKSNASGVIDKIILIQEKFKKEKSIDSKKVYEILSRFQKIDPVYEVLFESVSTQKWPALFIGDSHGDLTYKNIIQSKDSKITLIDFERSGERVLWGLDFCHYVIRCLSIQDYAHFISLLDTLHIENSTYTKEEWKILGAIESMLDLLQKKYKREYQEVLLALKNL